MITARIIADSGRRFRAVNGRYPRPRVLRVRMVYNRNPDPVMCLCTESHPPRHIEFYLVHGGRTTRTLLGRGATVREALDMVPYLIRQFRQIFRTTRLPGHPW